MIDFHSHVLPSLDDGSSSLEESVSMLRMLCEQGVDTVCATPHFNALCDAPDSFFEKRDEAYKKLIAFAKDEELPRILLGAEVAYFPGIGSSNDVLKFRIEGTRLLLVEMPMAQWSEYTVSEIVKLSCSGAVTVVLAHVERYLSFQKAGTFRRLLESGVIMQTNASFFISNKTQRTALKMLKRREVHLLGTDCHNLEFRPPKMGEAMAVIKDRLGEAALSFTDRFGRDLLNLG